ncbi:hypothetical protein BRAS3843_770021 [Bradyrhizobium sp. STM 3843]|uniref:hypothetical protein n=1 Tax=Bradyrhizobium sp. STM 3843 TaxID=551947 RepID=UPI0002404A20|nr:hypothetical protein [Bradyrhizobium sp. STM 3843]CCE11723.1 hypothetical protein BRAS3843_770021 [Bradyrhizobium sp. STM 3843]
MGQRTDRSQGRPSYIPRDYGRANDRPDAKRKALLSRKERFAGLNELAIKSGDALLTSVAGDPEISFVCLPSSAFPQRLRDLDYELRHDGEQQWILPHAITERFGRAADGTLVPLTAESTMAVVHKVEHAGIVRVQRWSFEL